MSGGFTVEDKSGEVIYASSPGMESPEIPKNSSKKSKSSARSYDKRPLIEIFETLRDNESNPVWSERFDKMAMYKFPVKISWVPGTAKSDVHGNIVYKNRQILQSLPLSKDLSIDQLSDEIKSFINNYTSIDMGGEGTNLELGPVPEDDIKIYDKSKLTPMPWNKLSSKDHKDLLTTYIKNFSSDNGLDKKESSDLLKSIILFAMSRNIFPYLSFDDNGNIASIKSIIYQNSDGKFKLNIPL